MQTILVTGSNGLLGQKLTDKLRGSKSYQLIATSVGADRYPTPEGYTYESLDITNQQAVEAIIAKYRPDAVINTAAMTNVDACESAKEACVALNVTAVEYLLEACKKQGSYLVHLSTDFIFDGEKGTPYLETDEPNPLSFYGQSKWDAEKVLIGSDYTNWSILRTIIVYGICAGMSRTNIVLWAKSALEKGSPMNVVDDQFRQPTLAEDLADCCILAVEKQAKGIFNASGKDYMSILELVYRVADFWKLDKSVVTPSTSQNLNQAAKRPPRTGFILDKTIQTLGYAPHSFEEGLAVVDGQIRNS